MVNIINCSICERPTSFERSDPKKEPPEEDRCEFCGRWVCIDCQDWSEQPPSKCIKCSKEE